MTINSTHRRFNETQAFIRRFVIMPDDAAYDIATLWAMHSHVRNADDQFVFDYTPRIAFLSEGPASGKTVALDKICLLSNRGMRITSPTAPAVTSMINDNNLVPFIDEIDELFGKTTLSKSDLRALLNTGYERGGKIARAGKISDVFGPVAFAGMGQNFKNNEALRALRSRTIAIWMQPKEAHQDVELFRKSRHEPEAHSINKALQLWGKAHVLDLLMTDPILPDGVDNRDIDLWSPLLAIAELAGDSIASRARMALQQYVTDITPPHSELTLTDRLIVALQDVFMGQEALDTKTIVERLFNLKDTSWRKMWQGNEMTAYKGMSSLLSTIGVAPSPIRITDPETGESRQVKGYRWEPIAEYIPEGYESVPSDDITVDDLPYE